MPEKGLGGKALGLTSLILRGSVGKSPSVSPRCAVSWVVQHLVVAAEKQPSPAQVELWNTKILVCVHVHARKHERTRADVGDEICEAKAPGAANALHWAPGSNNIGKRPGL
jgi:hypothetical protein